MPNIVRKGCTHLTKLRKPALKPLGPGWKLCSMARETTSVSVSLVTFRNSADSLSPYLTKVPGKSSHRRPRLFRPIGQLAPNIHPVNQPTWALKWRATQASLSAQGVCCSLLLWTLPAPAGPTHTYQKAAGPPLCHNTTRQSFQGVQNAS